MVEHHFCVSNVTYQLLVGYVYNEMFFPCLPEVFNRHERV